jgi:mRNA interferase RelE/StbE
VGWEIELTETAMKQLEQISDLRLRQIILARIEQLSNDSELQSKPLLGELRGLYSVRAGAQRYRVIYRLLSKKVIVVVVAVGIRKEASRRDIYSLARRLIRTGLLGEASDED